jgi:hypothetical protein
MSIGTTFASELTMEAATTRRVLERVPADRLAWRPHSKSMSLGQLALHVATLPQQLSDFVEGDALDFERWTPGAIAPRALRPAAPEPLAMPADDGLGLHEDEGGPPPRPGTG